jgi:MFS family permease
VHQAVRRPRLVLAVVATAAFFLSVDLTFVNVALPDIGRQFRASAPDLAWVVDGYTVALTSLLIPGAAVAERFGRKAVFLCGMGVFTVASLAGGLAASLTVLLGARVAMGAGAGLILGLPNRRRRRTRAGGGSGPTADPGRRHAPRRGRPR